MKQQSSFHSLHEKHLNKTFLSALVETLWGHIGNFVIIRLYGVPKNMQGISINYTFRENFRFGANTFHVPYSGAIVKLLFMTLERWKNLKLHEGKPLCSPVSIKVKNNRMITTSSHTTGSTIDGLDEWKVPIMIKQFMATDSKVSFWLMKRLHVSLTRFSCP